MTPSEANLVPAGAYRLKWFGGGGSSFVVVGRYYDGSPWYACANWTTRMSNGIIGSSDFADIQSLTALAVDDIQPRVYTARALPTTAEELDAVERIERNKELDKVIDELDRVAKEAKDSIDQCQRRIRELICGS